MAYHKTELRITVVDDFDWPALQESSILTPRSLCPRDVTLDGDEISVSRLTPNSPSGNFAWAERPRTPSSSHTFGFPLSPTSIIFKYTSEATSPLEKQKRRLRRYHIAETILARHSHPSPLSPSRIRANAINHASASLTGHILIARESLRDIQNARRHDTARWMAEHRLGALESLQADLVALRSTAHVKEDNAGRKREANLLRFFAMRQDETRVPVFTRTSSRRPLHATNYDIEPRHITKGSPMQLQSEVMPVRQPARSEWSWETRVRSVLLNPTSPSPATSVRNQTPTSSVLLSTPTSASFSSFGDPDTPLTDLEEVEEEDEDEDEFEDYPTFKTDSALSSPYWRPLPRPPLRAKPQPLPPLRTNVTPDSTYAWLTDPSSWASPSAWHGDGWEVPVSASPSSTASPMSASPSSFSPHPAVTPRPPTRTQTLPTHHSTHHFWSRDRPQHPRLGPLRPVSEAARDADLYAVKPLPSPPSASTPRTPQTPRTPRTPSTPQRKGLGFLSGLVRRTPGAGDASPHEIKVEQQDRERERSAPSLRKRGSVRSFLNMRSSHSLSFGD
ncbi:hypothetical protein R3P38DRAFT_3392778 [Favolaschia claudopus]|uniref:Uncharacterized protein n=1 Tax=Favolaschia claudopus TaxID=2862362 RepID=A0AAW0C287_9AGAR